jgi:hypothetical protein
VAARKPAGKAIKDFNRITDRWLELARAAQDQLKQIEEYYSSDNRIFRDGSSTLVELERKLKEVNKQCGKILKQLPRARQALLTGQKKSLLGW